MDAEAIAKLLEQALPRDRFRAEATGARRVSVEVAATDVAATVGALCRGGATRFVTLTAEDQGEDIGLAYVLAIRGAVVAVRTLVPKETSRMESMTGILPAAELIEKEVSELFGIEFVGHPRQTKLVLPEAWPTDQAPLRKPLAGGVLPQARLTVENLLRDAASIRVSPSSLARREQAGLPKRPPLASGSDAAMQEFIEMVLRTGFDKRAGYDWTKKRLRYR
jgi:Ni,Fe-hydrogenase III component G